MAHCTAIAIWWHKYLALNLEDNMAGMNTLNATGLYPIGGYPISGADIDITGIGESYGQVSPMQYSNQYQPQTIMPMLPMQSMEPQQPQTGYNFNLGGQTGFSAIGQGVGAMMGSPLAGMAIGSGVDMLLDVWNGYQQRKEKRKLKREQMRKETLQGLQNDRINRINAKMNRERHEQSMKSGDLSIETQMFNLASSRQKKIQTALSNYINTRGGKMQTMSPMGGM